MEVMVAAAIFAMASAGVLAGLLQARKLTEGSIYTTTATTIAQGYVEQLKNMEFTLLDTSTISELISQGSNDSLMVSPFPTNVEVGDPETDLANVRRIDLNNTPSDATDDLEITIVLYIRNITDKASGIGDSRLIALRWSYLDHSTRSNITVGNTLFAVRSRVPTF